MTKKINVAELFAGVGGFRVGLERADKSLFKTVYANQWEPSTKIQHAFDCYVNNFGETNNNQFHDNTDITIVNDKLEANNKYINNKIDLVVGGFPCQDYSVATTKAEGLQGKKGVLWWEIERFLISKKPSYLLLENVDRLLISPKEQKGRDFLIMLAVLNKHGYNVEWRIVNAAEYGFVQRRKRVFIFAQKQTSEINKKIDLKKMNNTSVLTRNLKISRSETFLEHTVIGKEIQEVSDYETATFYNYGYMVNGKIHTEKVDAKYSGKYNYFVDILQKEVSEEYFLTKDQEARIFEMKDGGKRERVTKDGYAYYYSEGKMSRFDNIPNKPSRTMLTSEGTVNRSTHVIKVGRKNRFITPIEAERLNGFNDNWTESIPFKNKRYFTMGNALVTGVVEAIGKSIKEIIKNS